MGFSKNQKLRKNNQYKNSFNFFIVTILLSSLVFVFLSNLAFGSVNIPIQQVVTILFGGEGQKTTWTTIILKFRRC